MNAADVMTRQVMTIEADAPIAKAVRLMLQNRISGLPVVDPSGRLVGIVTEGDFLRRTETGTEVRRPRWLEFLLGPGRGASEYVRTHARKVAEVMTPNVASVAEDTPVDEIVRLMEHRRIKRVPVVQDRKVVGIVSRANLLRVLAGLIIELPPATVDDTALRERILAELDTQSWAPRAGIEVMVRHGVVELWGAILDERERQALRVAAENVPGVKAVHDHLCWVEPMSGWFIEAPEDDAQPRAQGKR
jgi:CBS domain-containing protein